MNACCFFVSKPCPALCYPMDWSLPGSSIHGISQARILEWVAISSSRELPNPRMEYTSPALALDFLPLSHTGSPSECMHRCSYLSVDWVESIIHKGLILLFHKLFLFSSVLDCVKQVTQKWKLKCFFFLNDI